MKKKVQIRVFLACFLLFQMVGYVPLNCQAAGTASTEQSGDTKVTDLDLGDYQATMAVGSKQLLTVTPLPVSTVSQTITYASSDESVAKINEMGRITALKPGTTTIRATCQKITRKFVLTVTEESVVNTETSKATISPKDIEIANHDDNVIVDKTLTLTATVLPSTATGVTVSYSSSDSAIATVNSTGEVKGIAPGNVQITVTAGSITKTVPLTVKIATTSINVSSNCVVLKSGESSQLTAQAVPAGASQAITYHSVDTGIATVSDGGVITAKQTGNTTVIVSNGDMSNAVTVIVNTDTSAVQQASATASTTDATQAVVNDAKSSLIESIRTQKETSANVADCPLLTKDILKALYESGNTLQLKSPDYTLVIAGKDIANYENELNTVLSFHKGNDGTTFSLNDGKNLPGVITLQLNTQGNINYVYLYNTAKSKYEKLAVTNKTKFTLDIQGKYLLAEQKLQSLPVSAILFVVGIIVVIGLIIGYILVKKKYWFW
jgi:uncharacterized protein YjdB